MEPAAGLRPLPVDLVPHDPHWAGQARAEADRLSAALGACLVEVHHIGSTAIPDILAKPILDLMPVVTDLAVLDAKQSSVEALNFTWHGEFGLAGRRYCTKSDPVTGKRLVQLHFYAASSPDIPRHLGFRDYLRAMPDLADAYERIKIACRAQCPEDTWAYNDCKDAWIKETERAALDWARAGPRPP